MSVVNICYSAGSGYRVGTTKIQLNKDLFKKCQSYLSFNGLLYGMIFVFGIRTTPIGYLLECTSYWVVKKYYQDHFQWMF